MRFFFVCGSFVCRSFVLTALLACSLLLPSTSHLVDALSSTASSRQRPRPSSSYVPRRRSWLVDDGDSLNDRVSRRQRPVSPPFPDGLCGGTVVTIPPQDTYDVNVGSNSFLLPPRPIPVWLPPGYDETERTNRPVLYCHDGQNAMQDEHSWTGRSWRLTGALTKMARHGALSSPLPIVVLLPCADTDLVPGVRRRHLEYGDLTESNPFAKAHVDFVANTVQPLVQSLFATDTSSRHYLVGSSLGGQASLNILLSHPDKFHGAACLSPFFGRSILSRVADAENVLADKRIYLDIGGDMDEARVAALDILDHAFKPAHFWNPGYFWLDSQLQPSVRDMRDLLLTTGSSRLAYHEVPGGRHNERAWSLRIDKPLLHLLGHERDGEVTNAVG